MRTTSCKILYADDDSDDHFILNEFIQSGGINAEMVFADDGQEAIRYLENAEQLPALIILDLNMPRLDGRQTLSRIKKHPHFSGIPVVMLSTSENKAEQELCTREGAAFYFIKPRHHTGYRSLVQSLHYFI